MDYRMTCVVAVRIKPEDFVEIRQVDRVMCAHSDSLFSDPKVRFCPMCGIGRDQRIGKAPEEHPKAAFVGMKPFVELYAESHEVGNFKWWLRESLGVRGSAIGGLKLFNLNPEMESWEYDFALGDELCTLRGDGYVSSMTLSPEDIARTIDTVRTSVAALGLQPSVAVHFVMTCG